MKKIIYLTFLLLSIVDISNAQENQNNPRFIEVTGSAELEITPDEIRFQIGIEEYWEEEYQKGKEFKDYITKVPLKEIEQNLLSALAKVGVSENEITIQEIGKYWQRPGKNFKKSKTIELKLTDFKKVNKILSDIKVRGISSMKISELKHKNI